MAYPRMHTLRLTAARWGTTVIASLVLTATASAQSGTRGVDEPPAYDTSGLELTLPDASPTTPETPPAPFAESEEPVPTPPAKMEPPSEVPSAGEIGPTLRPVPAAEADQYLMFNNYPAPAESSGTWLNRGLWYADVEAVIMGRTWNDHGVSYFQEFDAVNNQLILAQTVTAANTLVLVQDQAIGESSPGYDANLRLSLGRFLFRDALNRDHTIDFQFLGGGELGETIAAEQQLTGDEEGIRVFDTRIEPDMGNTIGFTRDARGLHVPAAIDGTTPLNEDDISGFDSFDRATAMNLEYSSRMLNWELNYNVAERMRKDRVELLPTGQWIRRASPGVTYDYAAGLRYVDLEERLDWFAHDIDSIVDTTPAASPADDTFVNGRYAAHTTNDLYGFQLGFGVTYQSDRWNFTLSTKQGAYINDARARRNLAYTFSDGITKPDDRGDDFALDLHENGLSYVGTGSFVARYHLRQNWSLRAGWEFMYITGLALAPNQVNFNPAVGQQLDLVGDVVYHGVSVGSEFYW